MPPITKRKLALLSHITLLSAAAYQYMNYLESQRRISKRFYTTSKSLHSPTKSAAKRLLDGRQDDAFMCHFGLTTGAFDQLHEEFQKEYPTECTAGRKRVLDTVMTLALVLMWLHNTMKQETLCIIFGVPAATLSRFKTMGIQTLLNVFEKNKKDPRWKIGWPTTDEMTTFNDMVLTNTTNDFEKQVLEGVFGFVDGLNLRIQHPEDPFEQNAYYNGWKGDCYASQVLVYTPDGCIAYVRYNCPGSWHDAEIAIPLYERFLAYKCPSPFKLLADSAFPCKREFENKVLSVPRENAIGIERANVQTQKKHAIITKHRQAVEWGMRAIQGSFGRLHTKLPSDKIKRYEILTLVWRLHNFSVRTVGVNQINTVYYANWKAREQEILNYEN